MKSWLKAIAATPERRLCCTLLALCAIVYIPFAGNYGMWDPWETHYGEVARQMLERNDFVSLWWPGSPQDRMEFWSKPVLTFWLMAISMKLAGIEWSHPAPPAEMVQTWRVEWASRMPFVLLGILGVWATWEVTRRLAGRRAGAIAALILATSAQWILISRQAMTDMAFVVPMTLALAFAGLALLLPPEEVEAPLPRCEKTLAIGKWRLPIGWPHSPLFYVFAALFALVTLPQLIVFSVQVTAVFPLGGRVVRLAGIVPMLPYFAAFLGGLWWCGRVRNRRQLYLLIGYVLCALASLAKGPAGVGLPAIVLAVYLVVAGRWKEILTKLELPRGVVLFVATAFPWYHAMLIKHGMGFWNEFIGDNYVHRAGGRHGDRGSFEYYLQYIGYGMFPWSGLVTLASLLSFRSLRKADRRDQLVAFALVWLLVELAVMSLVNTKFHHYILPALPALAILAGVLLDEMLTAPNRMLKLGVLGIAAPITFLCGRDLAAFPPRILWLFNYDYVNAPGTGRPWPLVSLYGTRYEYGNELLVFAIVAALGTAALALIGGEAEPDAAPAPSETPAERGAGPYREGGLVRDTASPEARRRWLLFLLALLGALGLSIAAAPSTVDGVAPTINRWAWLVPTAIMLPFLGPVAAPFVRGARRTATLFALVAVGVVWSSYLVDKLLIELSPHWAQKHVIAAYYAHRRGPEEPLIAWQLYWRGENFYTKNELYRSANPNDRTVFLGDRNAEKMQAYFKSHPGRRVFFVVERARFESLRGLLPAEAKPTLNIVDQSNNKIYLAVATLPAGSGGSPAVDREPPKAPLAPLPVPPKAQVPLLPR
jgi:4-amino-4-deoxy-L-arabinose transferase-like glycosyltransferase